jgi:hypothetical protein
LAGDIDGDARMDRLRRAARYRLAQQTDDERGSLDPDEVAEERRALRARDVVPLANARIEQAEREGAFEHNPYHGRPLPGNDGRHDPDWWIRRTVEREQLTGLAPPALGLRKEDAELDDRLDAETSEDRVRAIVEDFDARIVEARRQLLGGPPVVTRVRDVDDEVARWRDRRAEREPDDHEAPAAVPRRRRRWFRRGRMEP